MAVAKTIVLVAVAVTAIVVVQDLHKINVFLHKNPLFLHFLTIFCCFVTNRQKQSLGLEERKTPRDVFLFLSINFYKCYFFNFCFKNFNFCF